MEENGEDEDGEEEDGEEKDEGTFGMDGTVEEETAIETGEMEWTVKEEDGCLTVNAIVIGGVAVNVEETADEDCSIIPSALSVDARGYYAPPVAKATKKRKRNTHATIPDDTSAVPPPKKKSKIEGLAGIVEEEDGYMFDWPKDQDSSVMGTLIAVATILDWIKMEIETGVANMD